ncbi:hypothetical protein NIES2100_71780 [Calothrix sp. NIES-2100]|uniref:hypothetical protein n=1 Tax=Calothrix sp. NIES-2100 TaxID=1954172 RepID=UPI000B5E37FE|nr:hypothetical protein NIES2100_71780 [Calothrix sp. NIES-2100]
MKYTVNLKKYNISINKHLSEYNYLEMNDNELIIKDYKDDKTDIDSKENSEVDDIDSKENSEDKENDKSKNIYEELTETQRIILGAIMFTGGIIFICIYSMAMLVPIVLLLLIPIARLLISLLGSLFHVFLTNPIFMIPFLILSLYNLYKFIFKPCKINRACGFFKLSNTLSFVENKYYRFKFKTNCSSCCEYPLSDISKVLCIKSSEVNKNQGNRIYYKYEVKLVMESKKIVVDLCNIDGIEPFDNELAKNISDFLKVEYEVIGHH